MRSFKILRAVGEGSFCKVRIVQKRDTEELYALKYISKENFTSNRLVNNIIRERKILESLCPHPFLVNLRYAFQDDLNVYMVVDLMLGGDLRYYLNNTYCSDLQLSRVAVKSLRDKAKMRYLLRQHSMALRSSNCTSRPNNLVKLTKFKVPEILLRHFMAQCCLAIHYIHSKGIIHRDIKPENILIDSFGYLHISDFNVSINSINFKFCNNSSSKKGVQVEESHGHHSLYGPRAIKKIWISRSY